MTLTTERVGIKKRIAALNESTKLERLRKEAIECERECYTHTSIFALIVKLFKKGGKDNGSSRTQETNS